MPVLRFDLLCCAPAIPISKVCLITYRDCHLVTGQAHAWMCFMYVLRPALHLFGNQSHSFTSSPDNSANSALVQTFKGFQFPFGLDFAVTNSYGGKTKQSIVSEQHMMSARHQ